jgi:N-acyl-D-aspartate/D-glutamate deacylase
MTWDLVIRGGRVVDGTGMPAFSADVAIKGDRIVRIGHTVGPARRVVEADGLVVAPGFIDVHTHYDAQLDWDPLATPSCFHGVTTVLVGNCGFTLAPSKPADVPWLVALLTRVEGMSKSALAEGLNFSGGSFGDYWKRFEGRLGINAGGYVGHCAIRRLAMGDAASEREATAAEIAEMQDHVRQSMREGAMGLSTSQLEIHADDDGRPVPSNLASAEEIVALCSVLSEFDHGAIEIFPRSMGQGYDDEDRALLRDMYRASGRPIELNVLVPSAAHPKGWLRELEFVSECQREGIRLHPMVMANNPYLHLKLGDTFLFDEMPVWREVLTQPEPERSRRLRDTDWRARMRIEWDDPQVRTLPFGLNDLEVFSVQNAELSRYVGRTIGELAAEAGEDPLTYFLDQSLADGLEMCFRTRLDEKSLEFRKFTIEKCLAHPLVMAGSSDAGAHLTSSIGVDYTTRLLSEWVPEPLSLEQAIWRLAGMPATVHGLIDRGFLRVGAKADIVIFDPSKLSTSDPTLTRDFPNDSERLICTSTGYVMTVVNGVPLVENGEIAADRPGQILRGA